MSDDDDTRAVSRPTGKRSSRRARSGSSDHETGSVATIDRDGAGSRKTSKPSGKKKAGSGTGNPFKRLVKFLKEVVQELRKVIWPNRKQMVTYTTVVLVFVIFTVAFIGLLDLAFIKGVNWLFG
nr:preprotein translocase subunit SecE [Nocardia miyunensis]